MLGKGGQLLQEFFWFYVFCFDLATATVASTWAGHHLHVFVLAFAFFDGLDYFLDVSEAVTFCHLYALTLTGELVLYEITVFYLLSGHIATIQSRYQELHVTV